MAYTNRKFTWDLDALKRFYERYVVKWWNDSVSLTDAQKSQARENIGVSAENTPYDDSATILRTETVQGAIDELSQKVSGAASTYDARNLPNPISGYYDADGHGMLDNNSSVYNMVTLGSDHAGKYIDMYQPDATNSVDSYVLLYASDGTTIREKHILNGSHKNVVFSAAIESGDKLAISCSAGSVPEIKLLGESMEARLLNLESRVLALENAQFVDL